jgi:hypothetical protein
MASLIRHRPEVTEAMVTVATDYGTTHDVQTDEMGVSLLVAGLGLLSTGMNDEQVRALLEQCFELTASLRRATEERWKRTGFDPGLGPKEGS